MMDILKLIISTIIMLAFVAAIMGACNAWNYRIFIIYIAVAVITIVACSIWPSD